MKRTKRAPKKTQAHYWILFGVYFFAQALAIYGLGKHVSRNAAYVAASCQHVIAEGK